MVVVEVEDSDKLASLELWTVYPPDSHVPTLHNPYVFDDRCLTTFQRVREAGFMNIAKRLISLPIDMVDKLRPEEFEKRGVPPALGVDVQNALARDRKNKHVKPIGLVDIPQPQPTHYQTTQDFLASSNFTNFAPALQSVPINRVELLGPDDFSLLRIPNWVGVFIQRTLQAAKSPEPFSLF
jgi:hypothetical protein